MIQSHKRLIDPRTKRLYGRWVKFVGHPYLTGLGKSSPSSSKWDSQSSSTRHAATQDLPSKPLLRFLVLRPTGASRTGPDLLEDWGYRNPHLSRA